VGIDGRTFIVTGAGSGLGRATAIELASEGARVLCLDIDAASGARWAEGVAREPNSPDFSFSVGGAAYFVVGLHPGASRAARRFCRPALIFNPHEQFERLRADGRYYALQSIIREREIATHGSINPMLSDFGSGREAAQYSGRHVDEGWTCPLKVRT